MANILNGKTLESISFEIKNKTCLLIKMPSNQYCTENPRKYSKARKEIDGIKIGKEIKISLVSDEMTV